MYSLAPQQVSYSQVNITMFTELPPPFHGHWSLITWALMSSGGTYSNVPMSGVLEQVLFICLNHFLQSTKGYCSSSASLDFTLLWQSLSYGENTSALNDTRQSSSQHPPAKLKNIRYKQYDDLPQYWQPLFLSSLSRSWLWQHPPIKRLGFHVTDQDHLSYKCSQVAQVVSPKTPKCGRELQGVTYTILF